MFVFAFWSVSWASRDDGVGRRRSIYGGEKNDVR